MKKRTVKNIVCFACTTPYQVIGAIDIVSVRKLTVGIQSDF